MIRSAVSSALLIPATVVMNIMAGGPGMVALILGAVIGLVVGYAMRGEENGAIIAQRERRAARAAMPAPAHTAPSRREIAA